jgi:hypothetical protein
VSNRTKNTIHLKKNSVDIQILNNKKDRFFVKRKSLPLCKVIMLPERGALFV